jgi:hypothetical protein
MGKLTHPMPNGARGISLVIGLRIPAIVGLLYASGGRRSTGHVGGAVPVGLDLSVRGALAGGDHQIRATEVAAGGPGAVSTAGVVEIYDTLPNALGEFAY